MKHFASTLVLSLSIVLWCSCGGNKKAKPGDSGIDGAAAADGAAGDGEAGRGGPGGIKDAGGTKDAGPEDAGLTDEEYCSAYTCWKAPPTGQTFCYDESVQMTCTSFPCKSTGKPDFCGQDAQYPRQSREFTESTEGSDTTAADSLTGLTWQRTGVSGKTWQEAVDYCDNLEYAGQTEWRLPSANELASLAKYDVFYPAMVFPDAALDFYWSFSPYAGSSNNAWSFDAFLGAVTGNARSYTGAVMCVSGEAYGESNPGRYRVVKTDGGSEQTVVDRATGLVWQQEYKTGKTWKEALAFCEKLAYGGYDDWRLPNLNELRTLADYGKSNPASSFPDGVPSQEFYSSSTYVPDPTSAWYLDFSDGSTSNTAKANLRAVKCVRDASI